jgi:hypothetical protein
MVAGLLPAADMPIHASASEPPRERRAEQQVGGDAFGRCETRH